jgi:hypothetical protein
MSDRRISQKLKLVALATGGAVLIGLLSRAVGLGQEATSVVAGAALGLLVGFGTPYAFDMRPHAAKLSKADGPVYQSVSRRSLRSAVRRLIARTPETAVLLNRVPDGSVVTVSDATLKAVKAGYWAHAAWASQEARDLGSWEIAIEKDGHRLRHGAGSTWWLLAEQQEPVPASPDIFPEDDATVRKLHPGASGASVQPGGFVVPEQTVTPQLA